MVDLVKLRKKKTRESGVGSRESEQSPAPELVDAPPIVAPEPMRPLRTDNRQPTTDNRQRTTDRQTTPDARQPTADSPDTTKLDQFKQTAGKRRAGFIEQEAETSSADQVELLSFIIAGEQYAVSIDHLVEIVTPRNATQVPNADPTIVGIISLRGTIVTVIDVRRKLRHPPGTRGNDTRIIVAERGGETLGFEVDRVLRVLKVDSAAIEPHPVVHSSELSEAVRGVFRHANALTILLDLDKLLA
jgi:purine-binding chemotaxis protein CheW